MKKAVSILLLALTLCLSACAKTPVYSADSFYYGTYIGKKVPGTYSMAFRLPGFSDGKCRLSRENGKPDAVKAGFAGVFAEDEGETVYQLNATEKMYPASMTKMMTALLVMENTENYGELVKITDETFEGLTDDSSIAYLHKGGSYSVRDLLIGLLIPSGNDAANALAIHVSGSVSEFVVLMNIRAGELGMFNTRYANPNGLHNAKHYTTVYDMYLLARECMKYSLFTDITGTVSAEVLCHNADGTVTGQSYTTTNSFVRQYVLPPEGVSIVGGKTGSTVEAGRCLTLIVTGPRGGTYIAVIGKVNGYDALYSEMNRLLEMIPEYEKTLNEP